MPTRQPPSLNATFSRIAGVRAALVSRSAPRRAKKALFIMSPTLIIGIMPPGEVSEAALWAQSLRASAPVADPADADKSRASYRERRSSLEWLYKAFMRIAPDVSEERLRDAVRGNEGTRIPLPFTAVLYTEFREGLERVLSMNGITDATVQAIGSAATGWSANPAKPLRAWTITSDLDFAIFSVQALEQARQLEVPVNRRILLNNEYVVLKNTTLANNGFYDTPLGEGLRVLVRTWNDRLFGDAVGEGIDFKLNLRTEPFSTAITVVAPRRLR